MPTVDKIKVSVADLQEGMYVCELDRPWLESPFLFQGFQINDAELLNQLRQSCEYVFVDAEQSRPDLRAHLQGLAVRGPVTPTTAAYGDEQPKSEAQLHGDYRADLVAARRVHSRARGYVDQALVEAAEGRVDTEGARQVVTSIIDSILHNSHAMMWLTYLKKRDEYTANHCLNVAILAINFGRFVGLERTTLELLGLGALLHDLGKMRVPPEILNKPGRLTRDEFAIMKRHPDEGYHLLKDDGSLPGEVLEVVLYHHERPTGKGYPAGLSGEQISLITKMTSIVDVYDAITSDRCYHDGISPYQALQNMIGWAGEFDEALMEQFIRCLGVYPVGTVVELNKGQVGIVIKTSEKARLRPVVLLERNSEKKRYKVRKLVNLAHPQWRRGPQSLEVTRVLEPRAYNIDVQQVLDQESLSPHSPSGL
jgi:putative nucleotidyltransferase with HDIG domain